MSEGRWVIVDSMHWKKQVHHHGRSATCKVRSTALGDFEWQVDLWLGHEGVIRRGVAANVKSAKRQATSAAKEQLGSAPCSP